MALAPLERTFGPSAYAPVDRFPAGRVAADRNASPVGPIEPPVADPRLAAPVETRPVAPVDQQPRTEPVGLGGLAASARAAAVALAAVPRDVDPADGAAAAADAQNAALDALSDPFDPPSSREVAQNFAAVAALVPSPQELANDVSAARAEDETRVAATATLAANDENGRALQGGGAEGFAGARLSRFA